MIPEDAKESEIIDWYVQLLRAEIDSPNGKKFLQALKDTPDKIVIHLHNNFESDMFDAAITIGKCIYVTHAHVFCGKVVKKLREEFLLKAT